MSGRESVDEGAFDYHGHKDGTVMIYHRGRPVTTLRGAPKRRSSRAASRPSKAGKRNS